MTFTNKRHLALALAVGAFTFSPAFASARQSPDSNAASRKPAAPAAANSEDPPKAPLTPIEKEELRARILMATKKYSEAAKAYTQLSFEQPRNASFWNFAGIAYMQDGDMNSARKSFEHATKVNKKFADGYNNLGAIFYAEKQYGKAISQYKKSVALQPQAAGFYSNLGYAYFGLKKYTEAFASFQKAMALDPTTFQQNDRNGSVLQYRSVTDRGLFNFMLAKSYAQMGDAAHCAAYLRRAFDEGYKDVGSARKDPAFAKVLADTDVKTVLDDVAPVVAKPEAAPHGS